ncbi:MAG TPA: hypothetical protein VK395_08750 [Gemmataceae bacterium]|nr:hypothetical protein [Gemmataceae bacterium]
MKTFFVLGMGTGLVAVVQPFAGASALPTWVERLGWTLVHSIWQFAAIAVVTATVNWSLRRMSANVRYIAAVVLLGCTVALPGVTWFLIDVPPRTDERPNRSSSELLRACEVFAFSVGGGGRF